MISERTLWATLALVPLVGACQIENVAVPQTQARIAVHSVLSPTATSQVVLLERTRTGAVDVTAPPFELEDPFGSDEGVAEKFATILLTMPDDQTILAHEDPGPGGTGSGVYRFSLPGEFLERNVTYRLTVTTVGGEILTAKTSVPEGAPALYADERVFDRAQDSVVLQWPASPGARSYFVRIDTPFGPRSFFTDSTRVRLTGELRNVDITSLPHVFIPGFPQAITVSAVDSNFYDWYRTHNDVLSGSGLINRVHGGLGVFGALVRLRYQNVRVTAPQREPASGKFIFTGTDAELALSPYLNVELYVESKASRSDQADALSGRYERQMHLGDIGCAVCGLLGSNKNGRIQLAFLRDWYAGDTAEVMTGELHGDTIVGTYRGHAGVARFVRQP